MNFLRLLLPVAMLLATATGLGLMLLRPRAAASWPRGLPLAGVTGLCALAATMPALSALGLARPIVLAIAYATSLLGWLRWGGAELRALDRRSVLACLLTLICALGSLIVAATSLPRLSDTVLIWWPKVVETAVGAKPYLGPDTVDHVQTFYPRGMAWLCTLASPLGTPAQPVMALTSWSCTWLTTLLMVSFGRAIGHFGEMLLLACLFWLLPEVAFFGSVGMADTAVGAAALLATIGLGARERGAAGYVLAAAAGLGAASIKPEGQVITIVVWAFFAHDVWRSPARRCMAIAAFGSVLVLLPWSLLPSGRPQTRMEVVPILLQYPDMLVMRVLAAIEYSMRCVIDPASFDDLCLAAMDRTTCWTGWLVAASMLLLASRRRGRDLVVAPAVALLPVALLVYVTTGVGLRWHTGATVQRLLIEVAPATMLAAAACLARREPPVRSRALALPPAP